MQSISNSKLTIVVKDHGAELASIRRNGREYLWQADPQFWARHSPVLFPIVGSVWNGQFHAKGLTYRMGQHGFARDMDFALIDKTADSLTYRLESTPETLQKFPYGFILDITYTLIDNVIRVSWHVTNAADEPLPFQIGAHPAFYWPMLTDDEINGGIKAMEGPLAATDRRGYFKLQAKSKPLPISVLAEGNCVGPDKANVQLDEDQCLPIDVNTFDHNALIFEDSLITKVTLTDEHKRPYVSLQFSSPLVGLWSPPHKRAPFVCIEPWYGRTDRAGYEGEFQDREWIQILQPRQSFNAHYDIIIEDWSPIL